MACQNTHGLPAEEAIRKLHNIKLSAVLEGELRGAYQVVIPLLVVSVCGNHEANGLVEHVYLVRLQVLDGRGQLAQQLCYEGLCLAHLQTDSTIHSMRSRLLLSRRCLPAEMSSISSAQWQRAD